MPPPLMHSDKRCTLAADELALAYASTKLPAQIHTSSKCKLFPPLSLSRSFFLEEEGGVRLVPAR